MRTYLGVMERDAPAVRGDRPVVLTNSLDGTGVRELLETIMAVWHASRGELVA